MNRTTVFVLSGLILAGSAAIAARNFMHKPDAPVSEDPAPASTSSESEPKPAEVRRTPPSVKPVSTEQDAKAKRAPASKPGAATEFPNDHYYYGSGRPTSMRQMEGRNPPGLSVTDWVGDPQDLATLKGKVVVVDFWGTWCPPCRAALPKNVQLYDKYKDQGLMVLGVHTSGRGVDKLGQIAAEAHINYPHAIDNDGQSVRDWDVSFFPTYFIIDRAGKIRAAGVQPTHIEPIVQKLLNEPAP